MSEKKPRLLWVGDAVAQTGFARVTHNVLNRLMDRWEIVVLGLNYQGDPHPYPYAIYPAPLGGDPFGVGRIKAIVAAEKPDIVVINNDPWLIPAHLRELEGKVPVVAYMPVDAPNQAAAPKLNDLTMAVAYTQFGRRELALGGYGGRCAIIPHGVDTVFYHPMPRAAARQAIGLPETVSPDSFIVGCVNRNQPRKRLDLVIQYFAEWWVQAGEPKNAFLMLHCSNRDIGYDIVQLVKYYGLAPRFIWTNPHTTPSRGISEDSMRLVYNSLDVHLNLSMGEGWGLTTHECMACGVANIATEYSGLGDWAQDGVYFVPATNFAATPQRINTIGGVADREATVAAIDAFYRDKALREEWGQKALAVATKPEFKWHHIADQFSGLLLDTLRELQHANEVIRNEKGPIPFARPANRNQEVAAQ